MPSSLVLRAGPKARATLQERGFDRDTFTTMVGASGGPKWLVLRHIDSVLVRRVLTDRSAPIHAVGSSIGTFRHVCLAQSDAEAAIERLERAYLAQQYTERPSPEQVSDGSRLVLQVALGERGTAEALANPTLRLHVVCARGRHLLASERRAVLAAGLGLAATSNALSRRTLGCFFERAQFSNADDGPEFVGDLPTRRYRLDAANLEDAVLASGSIPLVMRAVEDPHGAQPGRYRDGGIVDYHFSFRFRRPDGLVLYPHFFDRLRPGWFDKGLPWRRPRRQDLDDVLLIAPSAAFIDSLPGGRVPDRRDFVELSTDERRRRWRAVLDACRRPAEELEAHIEAGTLASAVLPFS